MVETPTSKPGPFGVEGMLASAIIQQAPFGLHLYQLRAGDHLVFMGANATANRILDTDCSKFVGMTIEEAFPALTATDVPRAYREVVRSGESWSMDQVDYDENEIRGAFEVRAVRVGTDHVAALFTEITHRLRTEHALRQKTRELDDYFDKSLDLLCIAGLDGHFKRLNPQWERTLGHSVSELVGKPFIELVHPDDVAATMRVVAQLSEGKRVRSFVNRLRSRSGEYRSVEWSSFPAGDAVYAVARDVTERLRAEERLCASEERFHTLFTTMTEMVAICELRTDTAGSPLGYQVLERNPALRQLPAGTRADLLETLQLGDDGPSPLLARIAVVVQGGDPLKFEAYHPPSKRHLYVSVTSAGQARFVVVATDITARVQAERERALALAELQSKNEEMESLLYVASHDLRAPLVNIQGFTARIARVADALATVEHGLPEQADFVANELQRLRSALEFVCTSASKMDALINGLLRVSRLGRYPLRLELIDMDELWQRTIQALAHQIQQASAEVEVGPLPPCRGDREQLGQVLTNLLDNALKYRSPDRACQVTVSGWSEEGGWVVYQVRDNGLGIAFELTPRVWELFHRLEPNKQSGEGIGLTAVSRIVTRHGGKAWVESELGTGSSFCLRLPAAQRLSDPGDGGHEQK